MYEAVRLCRRIRIDLLRLQPNAYISEPGKEDYETELTTCYD
jgi:hypothetical protein